MSRPGGWDSAVTTVTALAGKIHVTVDQDGLYRLDGPGTWTLLGGVTRDAAGELTGGMGRVGQAIVSSSKNAEAVLRAAGLLDLFEIRVDGVVAAKLKLPGKPRPDTFVEAARELGVAVEKAVVVEDALAGVEAGVAGRFGLVIGVDREGDPEALSAAGAHLVVDDLGQLVPAED